MLTPLYVLVGFAAGFVAGVNYGVSHAEPWKDLANGASKFALWARRVAEGGPVPPDPERMPGEPVEGEE
jgi:hypothetical protein